MTEQLSAIFKEQSMTQEYLMKFWIKINPGSLPKDKERMYCDKVWEYNEVSNEWMDVESSFYLNKKIAKLQKEIDQLKEVIRGYDEDLKLASESLLV
jgi:uncharacterized small protein (DUF1192 family)